MTWASWPHGAALSPGDVSGHQVVWDQTMVWECIEKAGALQGHCHSRVVCDGDTKPRRILDITPASCPPFNFPCQPRPALHA